MQTTTNINDVKFNFPVEIEETFTKGGKIVPRAMAIVRKDTDIPIASVSNRYELIKHEVVMDAAERYIKKAGSPEIKYSMSTNGGHLVAEFTFMNKKLAMDRGDQIGMRVYVENSYNKHSLLRFRVGGLVLSCMNGMVSYKNGFEISIRHTKKSGEIEWDKVFPTPERMMQQFANEVGFANQLARVTMTPTEYGDFGQQAVDEKIVASRALSGIEKDEKHSAWDLYNRFTYDVTHKSEAMYISKVGRLARISKWFKKNFEEAHAK